MYCETTRDRPCPPRSRIPALRPARSSIRSQKQSASDGYDVRQDERCSNYSYFTTIDEVECLTGFDFFAALPDLEERELESSLIPFRKEFPYSFTIRTPPSSEPAARSKAPLLFELLRTVR
jgi:hypothetical protein